MHWERANKDTPRRRISEILVWVVIVAMSAAAGQPAESRQSEDAAQNADAQRKEFLNSLLELKDSPDSLQSDFIHPRLKLALTEFRLDYRMNMLKNNNTKERIPTNPVILSEALDTDFTDSLATEDAESTEQ